MRKFDVALMLMVVLATTTCITAAGPIPERLYPPMPQPLRTDQVSLLSGYVQFVDDKDVSSRGTNFELLPGCHIIGTPSNWGEHSPGSDSVVTSTTGRWLFAIPMRANHQYLVKVIVGTMTGPVGSLTIKTYESDRSGKQTREFEHVTSPKDIENCRREAAH